MTTRLWWSITIPSVTELWHVVSSTDIWFVQLILWEMIRRLPPKFHDQWSEFCFTLRKTKKKTLVDFENWLQDRILAFKEVYLPVKHELKKNWDTDEKYVGTTLTGNKCILSDNHHIFFKCSKYKSLEPADWLGLINSSASSSLTPWRVTIEHTLANHQTVVFNKIVQRKITLLYMMPFRKHLQNSIRLI